MSPSKLFSAILLSSFLVFPLHSQNEEKSSTNLITNGNFEIADANGLPQDWTCSHPNHLKKCETTIELQTEGDLTFMRITKTAASNPGVGWQNIKIPEGATSLRIAAKMRGQSIVRGSEGWQLPGIGVTYFYGSEENAKPGAVDKWLKAPIGDSEWEVFESVIPVRDGATEGRISIIGQGWTGTFDITNIEVEVAE